MRALHRLIGGVGEGAGMLIEARVNLGDLNPDRLARRIELGELLGEGLAELTDLPRRLIGGIAHAVHLAAQRGAALV